MSALEPQILDAPPEVLEPYRQLMLELGLTPAEADAVVFACGLITDAHFNGLLTIEQACAVNLVVCTATRAVHLERTRT